MVIGIDVDGILADFNKAYVALIREHTGRDLFPHDVLTQIPCWNYPQHYCYTEAEIDAVWAHIKASEHFWMALEPYSANTKALNKLWYSYREHTHDLYFLTNRPGATAKRQTETWLRYHTSIAHPTVLVVRHPSEKAHLIRGLGIEVFLDDKLETVVQCHDVCRATLLDQTWNRTERPPHLAVVSSVQEFIAKEGLDG